MRLRFTLEALNHIAAITDHIEARNPRAAEHVAHRIFLDCDRLAEFPQIGHVGTVPGTFEWIVTGLPYIIVHELDQDDDEIIVLGVFHGARSR